MGLNDLIPDPDGYPTKEDAVVRYLVSHLSEEYDQISRASSGPQTQNIDLLAECDDHLLGVEVKADNPGHRQGQAYQAIGQILYRMDLEDVEREDQRPAVAFPREIDSSEPFKTLLNEKFSAGILERNSIWTILVDEQGYDEYPPGTLGSSP